MSLDFGRDRRSPQDPPQADLLARGGGRGRAGCGRCRRCARDTWRPLVADGVGLDRARQYRGPHSQRPAARRGAGAAGEVVGRRRHRAHQFAGRHHRRLRAALRFAGAAEGQEAAGRGGRGAGRLGRLHRGACGRSHHCPAELTGRLDRRAVSISEFHRADEDRRRQGRGSEILAAEGRTERL